MHAGRLIERLLVLMLALTLGACGSVSASIVVAPEARTPRADNATPASTALPHGTADTAAPMLNPWDDVGWYKVGPHPSERGSAVIDGHLDRPLGYPAVFWRLRQMRVGDDVLVTNKGGKTLHFRVTRIAFYSPQDAPIQDIFGNGGGIYLNLITCAGDWIPSQNQTKL